MRLNRSIIKRLNRNKKTLKKLGLNIHLLKYKVNLISVKLGALIDQTLEDAVAQIQIVLRKKTEKLYLFFLRKSRGFFYWNEAVTKYQHTMLAA